MKLKDLLTKALLANVTDAHELCKQYPDNMSWSDDTLCILNDQWIFCLQPNVDSKSTQTWDTLTVKPAYSDKLEKHNLTFLSARVCQLSKTATVTTITSLVNHVIQTNNEHFFPSEIMR